MKCVFDYNLEHLNKLSCVYDHFKPTQLNEHEATQRLVLKNNVFPVQVKLYYLQ